MAEAGAHRIIYVDALGVVCAHDASALRANELHTLLILVVGVGPLRRQVVLAPVRVIPRSLRAHTALLAAVTVTHIITSVSDTRSMRQVYQPHMLGLTWQSPQAKTVDRTPHTARPKLTCSGGPHVVLSVGPLHGRSTYARHFSLRTWQNVSPGLQKMRARLHRHLFPSFRCSFVGPLHGLPCVSFRIKPPRKEVP